MTRMRLYLRTLLTACLLLLVVAMPAQQIAQLPQDYAVASDYTDCKNSPRFSIPLDLEITESYWLKGYVRDLTQGVSAYLYSDTDFQFEVFIDCFFMLSVYETTFKKNRTSTINFTRIQEKLAENGISDYASPFYIRITPINGKGGRLVMRPDSEQMYSDCNNPLYMAPGLNLRSSRTSDVYVLDPRDFPQDKDMFVRWNSKDSIPCQAKMTLGACNGQVLEEKALLTTKDVIRITPDILSQAAKNNQLLYFHFNHEASLASYVQCFASKFVEKVYEKTACQGKGVTIGDTTFYESTYYFRDTAYISGYTFYIRYYNITITEPEPQPDTIGLKSTQLPYTYRGQTITDYGDYDFTISKAKQCDQRYLLHVGHVIDTIVQLTDTTLCYGAIFEYEGEMYGHDVSFGKSYWKNQDTLILDTLNVYFATTPEIVYDTIMQHDYKYGKTFKQTGDFSFTYTDTTTYCVDSIYLHVLSGVDDGVKYDYYDIDTTLCQGMEYEDYYGNLYTTSTVLYDTIWRIPNKHCEIEITTITFTEPDIQFDTISLKTTQLPYNYNTHCRVDSFGVYDYTVHVRGRCDERYQLLVLHDIDTLHSTIDTTLCQGKVYQHNDVEYTTSTTLIDSLYLDADTYQVLTTNLWFTAPEQQYDTLGLKTTDLPYTYREQYVVDTFGEYDVLIKTQGSCDEVYKLYVSHDIDTTYQTVDTVLCQGKVYTYDGVGYTTDITLVDTVEQDADTYQILTIQVSFLVPDIQLDTISLKTTDLPYTYRNKYTVDNFGEHDVLIKTQGSCDEVYKLYVSHDIDTTYQSVDTVLCQGKVYTYAGVEYTTDITLVDTVEQDADTYQVQTIQVTFTAPELQYDTLSLKTTDLPYTYRDQYAVIDFGNHDVVISHPNTCDERYLLQVLHDIDTLVIEADTFLCYGKVYVQDMVEYQVDTVLQSASWLNADTLQIDVLSISFAALPDVRYDTLTLTQSELPYQYCDTSLAAFGDYELMLYNEEGCLEQVYLSVQERIIAGVDNTPLFDRPRLILRNGVVYILRGSEIFTLLGEKI